MFLRAHSGNDFSCYKSSTIRRRIERRMGVHQLERLPQYVRLLQQNAQEVELLYKELLIGVTNFFRDPGLFDFLREQALPRLLQRQPKGANLRVWNSGCSTGEETYSLAIALKECLAARETLQKYQDLFDFAPNGYVRLDAQGRILEINLAGAALLGRTRNAAVKRRLSRFVAADERRAFEDFCGRVREESLHRTHALLETLLTRAPVGFAYFDLDLRYVLISDRLAEINGLPRPSCALPSPTPASASSPPCWRSCSSRSFQLTLPARGVRAAAVCA